MIIVHIILFGGLIKRTEDAMKLLYTNENPFLVNHVKNMSENAGFAVVIKNELLAGAVGELSPLDTWPELWLLNEQDYEQAHLLLQKLLLKSEISDWVCQQCEEKNDSTFDICWQCQADSPEI